MMWAVAGLAYAGAYVALMLALAGAPHVRGVIGDVALLAPPLAPLFVIGRDRRRWTGRQAVFWGAIAAWAALWAIGEAGFAIDELVHDRPLPLFQWHLIPQLSASALPLFALVAWPHQQQARADTPVTAALDISVLLFLSGFLVWSLIVAPARDPAHVDLALRLLAVIGPLVRAVCIAGLGWAALRAGKSAWADVYRRLAFGMLLAMGALIGFSLLAVRGEYQTGSPGDIGWMLPFWFAAWAAATSPASPIEPRSVAPTGVRHASPALLFVAVLLVPLVGYSLRYVMPAGADVDRLREIATSVTLVAGVALVMVRLRVEQHTVDRANEGLRLLATACEQAGELILITRDRRIVYANDALCRACGYAREEIEEILPESLIGQDAAGMVPALREDLRARRTVRAMAPIRRKDGTTFQAACVGTPLVDAAGRVTHIVAVIRHTTEELRLREHLVRGERMSAIGEFVSGVAHELNNPLQSVIGSLELMLGQPHSAETRGDLERARVEAARAGRIIRNLLTFVRQAPNERLLLGLNEIVQSTVGVRRYELELAGIELREEYAPHLPVVLANREEIQQVVANLLVNAQQAMSHASGRGVLRVRTLMDGESAVIEVSDDGPGIPEDLAGRVFEPFFTTRAAGSGTGLGLSMSFGIVKAHGGTLTLVPSERGACFRLALPGAGFPGPATVY